MGYNAKKTEHCGAKRGRGAYYGHKKDAKQHSRKRRRSNAKKEIDRDTSITWGSTKPYLDRNFGVDDEAVMRGP